MRKALIQWMIGRVSIRAPRVRGDPRDLVSLPRRDVSIRAPRVRGDFFGIIHNTKHYVSIRAPRVRGDILTALIGTALTRFNPRPSCEGRYHSTRNHLLER